MEYELYNFTLEITKTENKDIYMSVKNGDYDIAKALIDDYIKSVDGYRIFNETPIVYTNYEEAIKHLSYTTYRFSECGSSFVVVEGNVLAYFNTETEDYIDYEYSKCC